jgi:hypothetical protein
MNADSRTRIGVSSLSRSSAEVTTCATQASEAMVDSSVITCAGVRRIRRVPPEVAKRVPGVTYVSCEAVEIPRVYPGPIIEGRAVRLLLERPNSRIHWAETANRF